MGLLADIGRSRVGTDTIQGLSNLTSDIQNRRVQREQLGMQQSEEARKAKAFEYQEKAFQEKEALNNKFIPLDELFKTNMPNSTSSQQKDLYEFGKSIGVIENVAGRDGILYKNLSVAYDVLNKSQDMKKKLAMSGLGDIEQQIPQLEQAMAEAKKPEEKQAIEVELAKLRGRRVGLFQTIKAMDEDLLKEEVKASLKGGESSAIGKITPDKFTPESIAKFQASGNYADLVPTIAEKELSPRDKAFERLSEAEQRQVLLKPGVSVSVGITKATQTELEKSQMDAEQNIMSFNEIERLFKPEFLTYKGQGTAMAQKYAEKLGVGTPTKFLQKRTAWMQQAKSAFLAYRKWVTGVAGGEKEMVEIAKSFPDPENNSPTEFMSNLKQARSWRRKVLNWTQYTRARGLSIGETPEDTKRAKVVSGGLEELNDAELLEMLEGYQ